MKPEELNCEYGIGKILCDYVDGTLDEATRKAFERHLEGCAPCWAFLRTYEATIRLTRQIPAEEMPKDLHDRLHSFLRERIGKSES